MYRLETILSDIPLASVLTLLTAAGALYALLTGQINYVEFAGAVSAVSAGSGVLGLARNGAGHGLSKAKKEQQESAH
jgi:hypothetical protein